MSLHTDARLLAVLGISDRCAFGAELRHPNLELTRVEVRTRRAREVSNAEEKVERQHAWESSGNAQGGREVSGQPTKGTYEQLRCVARMWRTRENAINPEINLEDNEVTASSLQWPANHHKFLEHHRPCRRSQLHLRDESRHAASALSPTFDS